MTRSLVETSIRSLFVVAPADSDEREIRLRQAEHYAFSAAIKRRRALADEAGASQLAQTLDELKSQQRGRKGPPPLSDMASELDLGALYDDLYRPASIPVHGSLLALADDAGSAADVVMIGDSISSTAPLQATTAPQRSGVQFPATRTQVCGHLLGWPLSGARVAG
jgi:hypothetical protein